MQKKIAVVTGASSGIGEAAAERISRLGFRVIGIGRSFSEKERGFEALSMDLRDFGPLREFLRSLRREGEISLLVNSAGVAYYGLQEELGEKALRELIRTDLELPILLTALCLRELKKNRGQLINISSVTARCPAPRAAAYGAAKAGLLRFGESIFEEGRKAGLRVSTILPDMTESGLYRNADFTVSEEPLARLLPEDVADALEFILTRREGVCISELVLKPQLKGIRKKTG